MCTCIDVPLLSNSILWAVPANGFTEELNWIVVSHYSFSPCVTVLAEKKILYPKYKLKMAGFSIIELVVEVGIWGHPCLRL